jgi:hypothetical protein
MGTLWTDARLWPTELDQNQNSLKDGFQQSKTISQTRILQRGQTSRCFAEKEFAFGAVTIIAIFVSAIYLVCHYLL